MEYRRKRFGGGANWGVSSIRHLHQLYGHLVNKDDKKLYLSVITVQNRPNLSDCGLFAIANGFEIVSGGEPGHCFYDCGVMRKHLASVLIKQELQPFPKDTVQQKRDKVVVQKVYV